MPEFHGGPLLSVVAVAVVHARDVLLFRMIEDSTDHKPRDAATRHQARRGAPEVVPTNVSSIAWLPVGLRLGNDVGTCTLGETSSDVLVVAHERPRKDPDRPLDPWHAL